MFESSDVIWLKPINIDLQVMVFMKIPIMFHSFTTSGVVIRRNKFREYCLNNTVYESINIENEVAFVASLVSLLRIIFTWTASSSKLCKSPEIVACFLSHQSLTQL